MQHKKNNNSTTTITKKFSENNQLLDKIINKIEISMTSRYYNGILGVGKEISEKTASILHSVATRLYKAKVEAYNTAWSYNRQYYRGQMLPIERKYNDGDVTQKGIDLETKGIKLSGRGRLHAFFRNAKEINIKNRVACELFAEKTNKDVAKIFYDYLPTATDSIDPKLTDDAEIEEIVKQYEPSYFQHTMTKCFS